MINVNKVILMLVVVFSSFYFFEGNTAAANQTGFIEIQDNYAKAKVGTNAPELSINDNGVEVTISFEKPTVLLRLNHYQTQIDPDKFNSLYKKWKGKVDFYIIADSSNKDIDKIFDLEKLSIPILLVKQHDRYADYYTRRYNQVDPSLVIIDGKGIIRYNSSAYIVVTELDNYLKDIFYNKSEKSPQFSPIIINNFKQIEVPKFLYNGDQAGIETFKTLDDTDYIITFKGKPTVLFFWLQQSSSQSIQEKTDMMQEAYDMSQGKVRFFSVAGSVDKKFINRITNGWNYSIAILRLGDNKYLKYTRSYPSFIVIDKYGKIMGSEIKTKDDLLQITKILSDSVDGITQDTLEEKD